MTITLKQLSAVALIRIGGLATFCLLCSQSFGQGSLQTLHVAFDGPPF